MSFGHLLAFGVSGLGTARIFRKTCLLCEQFMRERYNSQYALPPFLPARPISCSRSDSLGGTYAEVAAVGGTHFSLLGVMGMVARW